MTTAQLDRVSVAPQAKRPWWRRPWTVPLGVVIVAFLAYVLPPYLSLDPARSRVPAEYAWYYPVLVTHILCGTVAMVTGFCQVWPWFRRRFPVAHRRIGRVYVFGGAVPAALAALTIGSISPFGPINRVSNVLACSVWLYCTITGYRRARQRRFGEHRAWMIRSYTIALSTITNRVWMVLWMVVLVPQLDTTFGGSEIAMAQAMSGITAWLGWVLPLVVVEWWLVRGNGKRRTPVPSSAHAS